ncbi:hypothetical protein DL93DRAFT_2065327 [Clavulina sp. PMI_390]|nr:hypothetical protein DL93DRAFT_2065327 [Clavulina sp. PMI_390]
MAKRKQAAAASSNGAAPVVDDGAEPVIPNGAIASSDATMTPNADVSAATTLEPVKVNNANVTELKIACDDAVRRYFSRPDQFRTRHRHTDVRLALGWASVIVAGATGYYGWKRDFDEAKPLVTVGVVLYFLLTTIQTLYAYYVEGKTIFVGKRKTLVNRIESERIEISSETLTSPPSSKSTLPRYSLTLSYSRHTGGGKPKTVLRKASSSHERPYTDFFDEDGNMDEARLVKWLSEVGANLVDGKDGVSNGSK